MNQPTNYFDTIFTAESIRAGLMTNILPPSATKYQAHIKRACLSVIKKLKANEYDFNIREPMENLLVNNHIGYGEREWVHSSNPSFNQVVVWRTEQTIYETLLPYSIYQNPDLPLIIDSSRMREDLENERAYKFGARIEEDTGIIFAVRYMTADGKKIGYMTNNDEKNKKNNELDIMGLDLCVYSSKTKMCGCGCGKLSPKMKKPASLCGTRYCSVEHQLNDWAKHKVSCETCLKYSNQAKALRAERNLD